MVTRAYLLEANGSVFKVRQLSTAMRFFPAQFICVSVGTEEKENWTMKSKPWKEKRTQDREVRDSRKVVGFMDYGFQ